MKIISEGKEWGKIEVYAQKGFFYFTAEGKKTDKVLRIWGISDGKEPLLIGIPEPDGDKMRMKKRISKEYMKNCGYLLPPERYAAGETAEQTFVYSQKHDESVDTQDFYIKSCAFNPAQPFELAEYFTLCNVEGDRATIYIDRKTGRPVRKNRPPV